MLCFDIQKQKQWVWWPIKVWRRVFKLAQNSASINIMEECIILIGEIREPTIIDEDVLNLTVPFWFIDSNWQGRVLGQRGCGRRG
jgi:hypothetical protein